MNQRSVEIEVVRHRDHLDLRWHDRRNHGGTRFDRVPGARPEWIAEADALLAGADRRSEGAVLDAVSAWAVANDLDLGVWHADGSVEVLVP